jgi:ATP phosphoribosyltransferase
MLKIALPNKGRLAEDVRELFADAGLEIRVRSERALTAAIGDEFQALFVRSQDIPEFVADGAAHAGITGWDLVRESGRTLDDLLDLEFGKCRLVVAAREEGISDLGHIPAGARVASCFPNLTRAFFAERAIAVAVVPVSGAAEVAPHLGIAELIVDLTSTGSTLKTNGLRELATLLTSTARLVAKPDRAGEERRKLDELTMALASVIRARGKRYLMANAPRSALEQVREVLPGLSGPTVTEVLDGGRFVAVHAVVSASSVYRTISALKAIGCEGILVTRIERLVP